TGLSHAPLPAPPSKRPLTICPWPTSSWEWDCCSSGGATRLLLRRGCAYAQERPRVAGKIVTWPATVAPSCCYSLIRSVGQRVQNPALSRRPTGLEQGSL